MASARDNGAGFRLLRRVSRPSGFQTATQKVAQLMPRERLAGSSDAAQFTGLHWMAAGMFLAAGAELLLLRPEARSIRGIARWAPLIAAPLAGASHVALALRPDRRTRQAARLADAMAISAAGISLAATVFGALGTRGFARRFGLRTDTRPPMAPLTFGVTGILGLLLDREEEEAERQRRSERRRRLLDRLFPRRRLRVDRIVVHV